MKFIKIKILTIGIYAITLLMLPSCFSGMFKKETWYHPRPKNESVTELINRYTAAIKLNPLDADAYIKRAGYKLQLEEIRSAKRDYTKAIRLHTKYTDTAYYNRGLLRIQYKLGNGRKDLEKAIKINPKYVEAYIARAKYLSNPWKNGGLVNYKWAIEDWTKVIEISPENAAMAYYERGNCKHATKGGMQFKGIDEEGACADWKKAASLGKESAKDKITESKYCK